MTVLFSISGKNWTPAQREKFKRFEECKPQVNSLSLGPAHLSTWIRDNLGRRVDVEDLAWEDLSEAAYGDKEYGPYLRELTERMREEEGLKKPVDARGVIRKFVSLFSSELGRPIVYLRDPRFGDLCHDGSRLGDKGREKNEVRKEAKNEEKAEPAVKTPAPKRRIRIRPEETDKWPDLSKEEPEPKPAPRTETKEPGKKELDKKELEALESFPTP